MRYYALVTQTKFYISEFYAQKVRKSRHIQVLKHHSSTTFGTFGPSEVRAASGQHLGGHYFGPSEVRATSGQHLGGHYFR